MKKKFKVKEPSSEPEILDILRPRFRTGLKGKPIPFYLSNTRLPSTMSLNLSRLDSIQSILYHQSTPAKLVTRESREVKSLVDMRAINQKIESESQLVSKLDNRAVDLLAIKQLMGPVTALWSDCIIPSARASDLSEEELQKLAVYCEHDIRATVKKDKRVAVGIAAYYLLSKDRSAGVVLGSFADQLDDIQLQRAQWPQLVIMAMATVGQLLGDQWIVDIMARILPYATRTTITWQRAANRRLSYINDSRVHRFARELNLFLIKGGGV